MASMVVAGLLIPSLGRGRIPSTTETPGASHAKERAAAGPWGQLEYTRFALGQPDEYLPDSTRTLETVPWFFEKYTGAQLRELFRSVIATDAVRRRLLDTSRWEVSTKGVLVKPTPELLHDLGGPARQQIYSILNDFEANYVHRNAFRFRLDGFDEWFAHSELTDENLDLLRSLTFTNQGGAICIVDLDVLQRKLTTNEFRRVFESLYSEPCLLIDLRVGPGTDVDALARYWGRGGRESNLLPLLRSLAKSPGGTTVSIGRLLPPFAQSRLYTFSPATTNAPGSDVDCFWTAMNFFNAQPDPGLATRAYALDVINRDYRETTEARRFGDMLVLYGEQRQTIHACVYIADDVVFTKNGADYLQPWVLMKIPDMLAHYATDERVKLVTLRPRKF